MIYEIGANVEFELESALLSVLQVRTSKAEIKHQLERYLSPGIESFQWVFEGEEEPPAPFGKLTKKSQARFGNGLPVYRREVSSQRLYLEEWWRITIELVRGDEVAQTRSKSKASLDTLFSQIMREQFKFPKGRSELSALGLSNVRLIDEGEGGDGNAFSFDCSTGCYFEPLDEDEGEN